MARIVLPLLAAGLLLTAAGGLMGCGKKGPLYLPNDSVQQEQADEEQKKKQTKKQY